MRIVLKLMASALVLAALADTLWRNFNVVWVGQYWAAATPFSLFIVAAGWPIATTAAAVCLIYFIWKGLPK